MKKDCLIKAQHDANTIRRGRQASVMFGKRDGPGPAACMLLNALLLATLVPPFAYNRIHRILKTLLSVAVLKVTGSSLTRCSTDFSRGQSKKLPRLCSSVL